MHANFVVVLFGYDRADAGSSANYIWRAGTGSSIGIVSLDWSDLAEGRCDTCEAVVVGTKTLLDAAAFDVDQEIRIYLRGPSQEASSCRYYGYIKEISQGIGTHDRMKRTLIIGGLMEQLDDVLAFRFYNNHYIGKGLGVHAGVVAQLLSQVILGESNVNVESSETYIQSFSTFLNTADYPDVPVSEAIARLAEAQGNVVYGVNQFAKLCFAERNATYTHTFKISQNGVKVIRLNKSNQHVRNKFVIRCKTLMAGGELVFELEDDRLESNPDMRIRQLAVNTPEFADNTGALDYGNALIEKLGDPSEPIRLEIAEFSDEIYPIERIRIQDENGIALGSFPIKALNWNVTPLKCALVIELGELEPETSTLSREIFRNQRIGASRELSNNIELSGERYAWLSTMRRVYSHAFQTRNFWAVQTDDEDSMDLPGTYAVDQYPVFVQEKKAVTAPPIPRNSSGTIIEAFTIESKQVEVGIVRDKAALGVDNEFRSIWWQNNEYKYFRAEHFGANGSFTETEMIRPLGWESGSTADTALWYEAVMGIDTGLVILLYDLRSLPSTSPDERFHIYWDVHTSTATYPPEDNSYHVEFNNAGGTLEFRLYEEHLGSTTQKYFDSAAISLLTNSPYTKVEIKRSIGTSGTATQVIVYYWPLGASDWSILFDTGELELTQRKTKSYWGFRWDMNQVWSQPGYVYVARCFFSGPLPVLHISRDEGENWKECTPIVLYDISGEPTVGTSLKMKMALTHYHLVKGWCIAFK